MLCETTTPPGVQPNAHDTFIIRLSKRKVARTSAFFPLSHGARVDDRSVVSGTVYVIRNGLSAQRAAMDDAPTG